MVKLFNHFDLGIGVLAGCIYLYLMWHSATYKSKDKVYKAEGIEEESAYKVICILWENDGLLHKTEIKEGLIDDKFEAIEEMERLLSTNNYKDVQLIEINSIKGIQVATRLFANKDGIYNKTV